MKKLLVAAFVAAAFTSAPAIAADMPTKAPYTAPAMYDWSGVYIGGHLGYQWSDFDSAFVTPGAPVPTTHQNVAVGGFQGGIQQQWNNLVLGIEGGWTDPFSHSKHQVAFPTIAFTRGTAAQDEWWIGGRAGWSMGNWMPYITGGFASMKEKSDDFTTAGVFTESAQARHNGTYIGGGVDVAVAPSWIFGVEYRHYDFKTKIAPAISAAGIPNPGDDKFVDPSADSVLLRLSYKFGTGKAPVVAKY
jgi:opacity protein-like surface antigen